MSNYSVEIRNLYKTYTRPDGGMIDLCRNISFELEKGRIYSIIGNSGSGKTTLINMIAGFESYDKGQIILDGGNKEYKVGILFQDNVLYPWKTIMENMLFACKNDFLNPQVIIRKYLKKLGMQNIEKCYPNELSGGMQQRIALIRVLLTNPDLVILDEAFGALDFHTRNQMQDLFLKLHEERQFTALVVTHDLMEAIKLGDDILVFHGQPLQYEIIHSDIKSADLNDNILEKVENIFRRED